MMTRRLILAALLVCAAWAGDKDYANLSFKVVRAGGDKPVRNAAVILHPVGKDGKQGKSDLELKTNGDGEI